MRDLIENLKSLAEAAKAPKKKKKLSKKALEREIEKVFNRVGHGVQIGIMDLGSIFKAGEKAYAAGEDMERAIKAAIEKVRKN